MRFSNGQTEAALLAAVFAILGLSACVGATAADIPLYGEFETAMQASAHKNSYTDVSLTATFKGPSQTITVNGFWDGKDVFKVRMTPTETGAWAWSVSSNDAKLNGKRGSFVCAPSKSKGCVRVSKSHPFGFEWTDGTPFFLLGDTVWHLWYGVSFADGSFKKLVDTRAAQHFDYIQGVMDSLDANEGGFIFNKEAAKGKWDCDTLNPAYFQTVDKKVDYMNSKGMCAAFVFAWGNERFQDFTPEQYKRYLRYMVARYASKNVFWIIAGEYEEAGQPDSTWISYMDEVSNDDPYKRPSTMHTINTTDSFGNVPSHTVIGQQRKGTPEYLAGLVTKSRAFGKPVINLEYGYESTTSAHRAAESADEVREDHWAITLAGGYGVYGNAVPGFMTFHKYRGFSVNATNSVAARQLSYLYEFFTAIKFEELLPSQQLVDRGFCASVPDSDYVVYIPSAGSVTVDLSGVTGELKTDWFDPKTGQRKPADAVAGGGKRTFTSPRTPPAQMITDWVLHVHR